MGRTRNVQPEPAQLPGSHKKLTGSRRKPCPRRCSQHRAAGWVTTSSWTSTRDKIRDTSWSSKSLRLSPRSIFATRLGSEETPQESPWRSSGGCPSGSGLKRALQGQPRRTCVMPGYTSHNERETILTGEIARGARRAQHHAVSRRLALVPCWSPRRLLRRVLHPLPRLLAAATFAQ